jgi:hypothetical protein
MAGHRRMQADPAEFGVCPVRPQRAPACLGISAAGTPHPRTDSELAAEFLADLRHLDDQQPVPVQVAIGRRRLLVDGVRVTQ